MRKITILIGLILLFALFSVKTEAGDPEQYPATTLDNKQKNIDKSGLRMLQKMPGCKESRNKQRRKASGS